MVTPSTEVIFCDSFSYPDGALLTNSAFLWEHRSGTFGQCQVVNRMLQITANQTEDVIASLLHGPYGLGSNITLYTSFKARFLALPSSNAAYFAHFADANTLRARIFASRNTALPGCFKLLIANGAGAAVLSPWNLHTNTTYTLVTRYLLDSASTTLWIDPVAESDPSTTANDLQSPVAISSYGFRQDAQLGASILVDDLKIGLCFEAVLPTHYLARLVIDADSGTVVLHWPEPRCSLQTSPFPYGPFTDLPNASSPYSNSVSGSARFFRLRWK